MATAVPQPLNIQANVDESDEMFARRLQAQELGAAGPETPLVLRNHRENPTVINARLNELSTARATLYVVLLVNIPQILAVFFILCIHWNDKKGLCQSVYVNQWKAWSLVAGLRMSLYVTVVLIMHKFKPYFETHPSRHARITSLRNVIDASGLIWFVVGNVWLFGDGIYNCAHPQNSDIYLLCVAMIIINYIQICLPCIAAIVLIPVFCFCMPCLIRILARMQTSRMAVGATEDTIRALPVTIVTQAHIDGLGDSCTCPICLSDMAVGDEARLLQCKHIFHKQCVDEWLRVNASCPTCRMSILAGNDGVVRTQRITERNMERVVNVTPPRRHSHLQQSPHPHQVSPVPAQAHISTTSPLLVNNPGSFPTLTTAATANVYAHPLAHAVPEEQVAMLSRDGSSH